MKATVLVDNIGNEQAQGEWGLSILVEYLDKQILLDVGASSLFSENADKLGFSIENVDYAVLSHAHYDHANGMESFFNLNQNAKFFLRDACGENCYKKKYIFHKYIGLPKHILRDYESRFVMVSGDMDIMKGVTLLPHKTPGLERIGLREKMYVRKKGKWQPDCFDHEQSLVFDTEKGLVIFNSCSHGGADNIIREVADTFPEKHIHAIIGGFHLFNKSEEEVRAFAQRVKQTGIEKVYTGHCTGKVAYDLLEESLGERLQQLQVGLTMEF